jgi:ABC-2 type transport system permease protein
MRVVALVKRICQQMLRDKRTLALLFVAPLIILSLMYFLFNSNASNPKLGAVDINENLVQVLEDMDIDVRKYETADNETITRENLEGLLIMNNGKLELTLQNSDPAKSKALLMRVNQAVAAQGQAGKTNSSANMKMPSVDTKYVYGSSESSFFDILSPILVGFFVFFFVFLISGIGLLRERTTGTLEKLMATPIRRGEVITGYLVGYGIFAVIQTVIVVLFSINVLDIVLVGSMWNVILINLALALVALSLGVLLSAFAASEFQMMQFIPIAIIPQIFFAGIFPLEGMSDWLQGVAKIMPMYYAAEALKGVMYKGWGLTEIRGDLLTLALFAVIFVVLNIFALKKYRKL